MSSFTLYYFDIETTGLFPVTDKIITIQYQEVNPLGFPLSKLNILKEWDNSERQILYEFYSVFDIPRTIFIGKSLSFDFSFLAEKMNKYELREITVEDLDHLLILDVKTTCVLINKGYFREWNKVIPNTNKYINKEIPVFYKEKQYDKIIDYIQTETLDFLSFYQKIVSLLPKLKKELE